MPRRFTEAKALMADLLNRYEAGAASPIGYPDYPEFVDVVVMDGFTKELREAESAGAIRIVHGRGLNREQIAHVALVEASVLYALLGRRPIDNIVGEASSRLLNGLDLPVALQSSVQSIQAAWGRGKSWQGFSSSEADRLRVAFALAKAILEDRHRGVDYRTFSRRIAGESKALEKLEGPVVRLLGTILELPPGARPRDALRTLGLEKFAPPMLLSGQVDFDAAKLSVAAPLYFGIAPNEASRLTFPEKPQYFLTIENFASFNRHIVEADPQRRGVTVYVGGYPSLATQEGLRSLASAIPTDVPLFHWSDIDPDGAWIFRTIERAAGRPLKPHLMSGDIAEKFGKVPTETVRSALAPETSGIFELTNYLQRDDAKWLEQEELDPIVPG
jgi:hypothetical protein